MLPLAATCLWLWQAGTFEKFWFWTVEYARTYVEQISLGDGIQIFWQNVPGVIGPNWPVWLLALVGAIALACTTGVPGRRTFVFGFLAFSFLCVCPGFYFRQHYFIVLLPCIAMLAGVGFTTVVDLAAWLGTVDAAASGRNAPLHAQRRDLPKTKAAAPAPSAVGSGLVVGLAALLPMAAVAWPVYLQSGFFFSWPPDRACRRVYGPNPFLECPQIAKYIKDHSEPDDRIAVIGSEPEIYFDADRQSATGYIYTYALMEPHPFARTMQDEMIQEIEAAKPEFLVYMNVDTVSWLPRPNSDMHILEWMTQYVSQHYFPVGLVDIISAEQTDYKWDADAIGAQPRSKYHLWVFREKP